MIMFMLLKFLIRVGTHLTNWLGRFGSPTIDFSWADDLINSLDVAFYLFPLYRLEPILLLVLFFTVLRIAIAAAKFLFDAIPLY